jgi:penicillin amidase
MPPAVAHGWSVHFTRAVIEHATDPDLAAKLLTKGLPETFPLNPFFEVATELALNWLEHGSPPWLAECRSLLWPALRKTVHKLQQKFGPDPQKWQWGKLHYVELRHPLAQIPGLGRTWKPVKFPAGGDGYTVNQSEVGLSFPPEPVAIIASCRMIIDVGKWDNSLAVLPGGQSGHPASAHYQDSLADWRNGRYHPMLFSRERIEQEKESITILAPQALPKNN